MYTSIRFPHSIYLIHYFCSRNKRMTSNLGTTLAYTTSETAIQVDWVIFLVFVCSSKVYNTSHLNLDRPLVSKWNHRHPQSEIYLNLLYRGDTTQPASQWLVYIYRSLLWIREFYWLYYCWLSAVSKFSAPTIALLAFWLAKKLRLWANSRSFTSYGK